VTTRHLVPIALAALLLIGALLGLGNSPSTLDGRHSTDQPLRPGWGIDARLGIWGKEELPEWLRMLATANLRYIRERFTQASSKASWRDGMIATWRRMRDAGYGILGWAEPPPGLSPTEFRDQLPDDLMAVYEWGRFLGWSLRDVITIWELPNEPDTMYFRDLPDRTVAYCKALYLGLADGQAEGREPMRSGDRLPRCRQSRAESRGRRWAVPTAGTEIERRETEAHSTRRQPATSKALVPRPSSLVPPKQGVLMPALGFSPGPWLRRAAENGIYDYTDGLNVHFYGHARDFRGALRLHERFAEQWRSGLPTWVTEAGINSTPPYDLDEERGREIQKEFTLETARVALEEGVAVFMPFVLVWPKEEWFAFAHAPDAPYPVWEAYAKFTREHSLPEQAVLTPPEDPSRIVLQWLPDYTDCIPHKVSGSYWVAPGRHTSLGGELRVYNFSDEAVSGTVRGMVGVSEDGISKGGERRTEDSVTVELRFENGTGQVPVEVPAKGMVALPVRLEVPVGGYLRAPVRFEWDERSRVVSAVETRPTEELLPERELLAGTAPREDDFQWIWEPEPFEVTDVGEFWTALNGVKIVKEGKGLSRTTSFYIERPSRDPRLPPMAVAKVNGLPALKNGFLRVRFPRTLHREGNVRVDLIDDKGQRFTVAEEFGKNRFRVDPTETWLSYEDFNLYAWGRITENPTFRPEDIREIQLRFFPSVLPAKIGVALEARGTAR